MDNFIFSFDKAMMKTIENLRKHTCVFEVAENTFIGNIKQADDFYIIALSQSQLQTMIHDFEQAIATIWLTMGKNKFQWSTNITSVINTKLMRSQGEGPYVEDSYGDIPPTDRTHDNRNHPQNQQRMGLILQIQGTAHKSKGANQMPHHIIILHRSQINNLGRGNLRFPSIRHQTHQCCIHNNDHKDDEDQKGTRTIRDTILHSQNETGKENTDNHWTRIIGNACV